LNASESDRARVDHEGLGQAGDALEDTVTPREDRDQELLDDLVLADDLVRNLLADQVVRRFQGFQLGQVGLGGLGRGRRRGGAQGKILHRSVDQVSVGRREGT
jgi:hypothetical protein